MKHVDLQHVRKADTHSNTQNTIACKFHETIYYVRRAAIRRSTYTL